MQFFPDYVKAALSDVLSFEWLITNKSMHVE